MKQFFAPDVPAAWLGSAGPRVTSRLAGDKDSCVMIEAAGSIIDRWLALHEQRRHNGLPTVSVLAGPLRPGISYLRDWASRHHRPLAVFEPDHQGFEAVVKTWIDRLVADRDLFDEAALWLSRQLDCPARDLGQSLRPGALSSWRCSWKRLAVIIGDGSRNGLPMAALSSDGRNNNG